MHPTWRRVLGPRGAGGHTVHLLILCPGHLTGEVGARWRGHHTPSQAQRPPNVPQRTWLVCSCTSGSLVGLFYPNPVNPCRPKPTACVCQRHQVGALGMCGAPSLSEGAEPQPAVHTPGPQAGGEVDNHSVWALDPQAQKGRGQFRGQKPATPCRCTALVPSPDRGPPHLPGLCCQPSRKPLAGASPSRGWQLPCHLCWLRWPVWQGLGEGTPAEGGKLAESTRSQGVPESGSAGGKGHLETRPPYRAVWAPEASPVLVRPLPACSPGRGRPWGGCASAWSRRSVSFISLSFSAVY